MIITLFYIDVNKFSSKRKRKPKTININEDCKFKSLICVIFIAFRDCDSNAKRLLRKMSFSEWFSPDLHKNALKMLKKPKMDKINEEEVDNGDQQDQSNIFMLLQCPL